MILLLLLYLIGVFFSVNLTKILRAKFLRKYNKKRQFIQEKFLFFKYTFLILSIFNLCKILIRKIKVK